ncbi:MAG TPA: hypothetical protein VMY39_07850, partial [Planctomycetota bacterium]|nr:hypothetical protein [Planctomycetota bacterium]
MSALGSVQDMKRAVVPAVVLSVLLSLVVVTGCGDKKKKPSAREPRKATPTAKGTEQREAAMGVRDKLEKIPMPGELSRTWFYDGDGGYNATVQWKAEDGTLSYTMKDMRGTSRGRRDRGKKDADLVLGFYEADLPRGPWRYLERAVGTGATLAKRYGLRDVRYRYYKAVVFDPSGKVLHETSPVQPDVMKGVAKRPAPTPPAKTEKKPDAPKKDAEKKDASKTPPAPPAPAKPRVAVVPFLNQTPEVRAGRGTPPEDIPPNRDYLANGMSELCREFLAGLAEVATPDPGYTDFILEEQRTARSRWSSTTLGQIGEQLGADMVLSGNFEVTDGEMRMQFSLVNVETKATVMSSWVKAAQDASNDMGAELARALADVLKLKLDDPVVQNFASRWRKLNQERVSLDAAMRHHAREEHVKAIESFEAVKPDEVRDEQVLMRLAESYQHRGEALKAARLVVLSTHVPLSKPSHSFRTDLDRLLRNAHDLAGALDLLADVRGQDPKWLWEEATALMNQAL